MRLRKVLLTFIFLLLVGFAFAQDDYQFLIKVYFSSPSEQNTINQLGLDIWESHPGEYLVYARQADLDSLANNKIEYSVLKNSKESILATFADVTDTTAFHTYSELSEDLYILSTTYPSICQLTTIGQTWENRQIYMVKISDNPSVDEAEPEICFIANQHAREWISEEVGLGLIHYLLENYATDTHVQDLINKTQIWIIPLANPDGKEYTHTTDRTWRKNKRNNGGGVYGVDINRNFSYQWGLTSGGSADSTNSTYFGPYAFSEPEDIAFRDFILSRNIKLIVNYHSYGQHVMYPWAYTTSPLSDPSTYQALCGQMRDKINAVRGNTYVSGQWSVILAYQGSGVTDDWAWHDYNIYCITIELSPSGSPGFYVPDSEIVPTTLDNIPGAVYAIEWVNQNVPVLDWLRN